MSDATRASFERLLMAEPQLDLCAPLGTMVAWPDRTLLHAGPPFRKDEHIPQPLLNSAAAAACFEGWATDRKVAHAALAGGELRLAPAQDYGVVTPLAFVVSPSIWGLRVSDAGGQADARFTPLNDGPPPAALRFGAVHAEQGARLDLLRRIGPDLARALAAPIALLPLLRAGLDGGDDLHGRVAAANAAFAGQLAPRLTGAARDYVDLANQFVLNVIMAGCAMMIGAGGGVEGSDFVVSAGGNGVRLGWKTAADPGSWQTMPATAPVGPRFANAGAAIFLPAIGDSAVIDACGFGAAALRYAPDMIAALRGHVDDVWFTPAVSAPFLGGHPVFTADLKLGLSVTCAKPVRGVMLAALDAAGDKGLIGRGIAPWPVA